MGLTQSTYFKKRKPGKTKAFFVCLLIAAFLWLAHALNTVYSYTIEVPVTFKNLPQNKKTIAEIPNSLSIQVKTSGLKLLFILLNKPFAPVDIDFNNLKSVNRNQNFILSATDIDFSKSLKFETQISRLSPDTLYFTEKTGFQKLVPVKVPLYIKCKAGFGLRSPVLDRTKINIWGDTALINTIDTIYTQALSLTDVDYNIHERIAIIKPDPGVYTTINDIDLKIEVSKFLEHDLLLPVNPIDKKNLKQVNIFPSKVKVRFTYLEGNFDFKDSSLFTVVVNSDKINPVTKKSPIYLSNSPKNITVMEIEPKEVEILNLRNK